MVHVRMQSKMIVVIQTGENGNHKFIGDCNVLSMILSGFNYSHIELLSATVNQLIANECSVFTEYVNSLTY